MKQILMSNVINFVFVTIFAKIYHHLLVLNGNKSNVYEKKQMCMLKEGVDT